MKDVKVLIENAQNVFKVSDGIIALLEACCEAVLEFEKFESSVEVSVLLVDNITIRELNRKYRQIDRETDVLSFLTNSGEGFCLDENARVILGDVVISLEKVFLQAKEFGNSFAKELAFLFIHSVLHLLGYSHEYGHSDATVMKKKEIDILKKIDISAYADGGDFLSYED